MPRLRISLATMMLLVLTAGTASALYAKALEHLKPTGPSTPAHPYHLVAVFVGGILLTGPGLAAWMGHSFRLALVQVNLACLGFLVLIGLLEWQAERLVIYWFQATFISLVFVPLLIRRGLTARNDLEPDRPARVQLCEAIALAFLNMMLVLAGVCIQLHVFGLAENLLAFP